VRSLLHKGFIRLVCCNGCVRACWAYLFCGLLAMNGFCVLHCFWLYLAYGCCFVACRNATCVSMCCDGTIIAALRARGCSTSVKEAAPVKLGPGQEVPAGEASCFVSGVQIVSHTVLLVAAVCGACKAICIGVTALSPGALPT
jgi:hypothetical protein